MISKAPVRQIWSGGQTGVDRGALFVAKKFNIQQGGWCPKNRQAEDGRISSGYQLKETNSIDVNGRNRHPEKINLLNYQ